MDSRFRVEVISQTPRPQQVVYAAMHQDYSEGFVSDERDWPSEENAGAAIVENLLAGGRGHYGPLEHPQIVLNFGWFPHSTMQQMRTHRTGISFDVQSGRYTGKRIYDLGALCQTAFSRFASLQDALPDGFDTAIEECFYLRPAGHYTDRSGKKYEYTQAWRVEDLARCGEAAMHYTNRIDQGLSEEHARGLIPFDVRQHWVMSANARSLLHVLDLRWKSDAQLECQWLCDLVWPHFQAWMPAIAEWYKDNRAKKARLSP